MPYIKSNAINVFPCANRGTAYNLQSRLTFEYNLTNIINQLIDTDSFVISNNLSNGISFNIHGYYFSVSDYTSITNLDSSWTDVYATITISSNVLVDGVIFNELIVTGTEDIGASDSLDNDQTEFTGVAFSNSPAKGDNTYSLHILHRDSTGSSWYIPPESTVKFVTNSTRRSIKIDDGEL